MCRAQHSIPSKSTAQGTNSNADINSVNIFETFQNHSSAVTWLLIIIVLILLGHFFIKLYQINKRSIQRSEQSKRLNRVMSKLALEEDKV